MYGVDDADEEQQESAVEPEDSETRRPQVAKRPYTPTRAELEAHLPLHLEYRSWCPHCRAGRGISMQHRRDDQKESEDIGVTISLDCCFMTPEIVRKT